MTYLPSLIDLRELLSGRDAERIRRLCRVSHPRAVAEWISSLDDEEVWSFLSLVGEPDDGEIFSHLDLDRQVRLATMQGDAGVVRLLEHMAPDDRADLVQRLDDDLRERLLGRMAEPERRETLKLADYPEGTVGAVMSTDFAVLGPDLTVSEAIEQLRRQAPETETIYYAYVVDEPGRLLGLVSLKDLILTEAERRVADVMHTDVVSVSGEEDQQEAARKIQEYDLLALPVVHGDHRLVGIVTVDDVIDVTEEEVTTDFHRMAPVGLVRTGLKEATFGVLYTRRIPWLLVLVFVNIFSGAGIAFFEETIAATVALVFFLPLLIDSGGNAGSQSATLMIRALATGDVAMRDWLRLLGREVVVALAMGLTMGVAVSLLGVYRGGPDVAVVVAMTMVLVVLVGSLMGMSLPFLFTRFRLDPATASAPLITSLADISGVLIYFSIATWYLGIHATGS